jgi:hypothetical protein
MVESKHSPFGRGSRWTNAKSIGDARVASRADASLTARMKEELSMAVSVKKAILWSREVEGNQPGMLANTL